MFCPKCGNEVQEGSSFCGNCGAGIAGKAPNTAGVATAAVAGSAKRKGPIAIVAAIVVVVIAVVIGINVFGGSGGGDGITVKDSTEAYTWDELSRISDEIGKASDENAAMEIAKKYNLTTKDGKLDGTQTKSVTLSNGVKTVVQIVGFAHDEKADGGKAGITFIFRDSIVTHNMNSTDSNAGGWEKSEMRSYLNSEGVNLLPSDLKQKVVSVKKLTNNVGETQDVSSVTKTTDQLWLFSGVELCGDTGSWWSNRAYADIQNAEGLEYKLFRDEGVYPKGSNSILEKKLDGNSFSWWERSPDPHNSDYFGRVNAGGNPYKVEPARHFLDVCPGFCI